MRFLTYANLRNGRIDQHGQSHGSKIKFHGIDSYCWVREKICFWDCETNCLHSISLIFQNVSHSASDAASQAIEWRAVAFLRMWTWDASPGRACQVMLGEDPKDPKSCGITTIVYRNKDMLKTMTPPARPWSLSRQSTSSGWKDIMTIERYGWWGCGWKDTISVKRYDDRKDTVWAKNLMRARHCR